MALAMFFTQNGTYGPLFGELDFRDGSGRRLTPANAVVLAEHSSSYNFSSGNATDSDLVTYSYDATGLNALIVEFADGAPVATVNFYRGTAQFSNYAPVGIRVYQDTTYHGTDEANWPVETKGVDEIYSSGTYGWTGEYALSALEPADYTSKKGVFHGWSVPL